MELPSDLAPRRPLRVVVGEAPSATCPVEFSEAPPLTLLKQHLEPQLLEPVL